MPIVSKQHKEFHTDTDPFWLEDNFLTDEPMPHYDPNAKEEGQKNSAQSMSNMDMNMNLDMDKKVDEMKEFTTGVQNSLHEAMKENDSKSESLEHQHQQQHEEPVDDLLNFLG